MSRLKHRLMAAAGLIILIAAVARLNALDPGAQNPPSREGAVVHDDSQWMSGPTDDSPSANGAVHALFNLHHPETAPFPSDVFTVADHTHNTGRRVNLPFPDCTVYVSDCEDLEVINTLDGFGLQTRISIPFDGSIDVNTVSSETVFLVSLGSTLRLKDDDNDDDDDNDKAVRVIGINQVVWDVPTNTLHVESDELLAQHTRYALIVTDGLRDAAGRPVVATKTFRRFRQAVRGEYKHALLEAIHAARRLGVREPNIVTASVYTTQSITSVMERIRDQIKNGTPAPADFLLGPNGERAVFNVTDVSSIVQRQHTRVNPHGFTAVNLDLAVLQVVPGAVGRIAHGRYVSPRYVVRPDGYIPRVGTLAGVPDMQGYDNVYFSLFLPSGTKPPAGWPVAIIGHGSGSSRHVIPARFASILASYGIATIGISGEGFGFGSLGSLAVTFTNGSSLVIPDEGRSYDQNGDNIITNGEGSNAAVPRLWTIGESDGYKQTAIDLMQLVRIIEVGMDADGDLATDIDWTRIYFHGHSAGGRYGTILAALDPSVSAFSVGTCCGISPEHGRWAPGRRAGLGRMLHERVPSLINVDGITELEGVPIAAPHYNENKPLRNQPAVINTIAGAMEIQSAFEIHEWGQQSGQTTHTWIRHLARHPLPGNVAKPVLLQVNKGDHQAVNPSATAALMTGNLMDRALYYRHDLAFAEDPALPKNPHDVGPMPMHPNPLFRSISRGLQKQIAEFFSSHGTVVIHPEPARFFEVPIVELPEDLNYIR